MKNNFNGNVLVAKNGKIIYQKSFGYADFDTKRLLNDSSMFELASVSKQFTAMGVLLLVQQGKIKFSDTLRKFFPQLPYDNITIKNLLTHTSGLPAYDDEMALKWDHKKVASNDDVIHFLATEKPPVHFQPGTQWEYSNTAYVLLASIIEQVSGQTFLDYLAENVFNPLGMTHSRLYNTRRSLKEVIPNYAYGFVYSDSLKKYVLPDSLFPEVYYLDGNQGDGLISSTTGDLLKWEEALKNHSLLNETLQKEMLSPQSLCDSILKTAYGYGNFLARDEHGESINHAGSWPGYGTFLIHYPKDDITIVVLCNNVESGSKPEHLFAKGLADIVFDNPLIFSGRHKAIKINPLLLSRYVGKYQGETSFELIQKNGKLYRHEEGRADVELRPASNTSFYSPGNRLLEFWVSPWGGVGNVFLLTKDKSTEVKRK
ncbi:MAG TPA: serine hydrolase domain-containing protein [Niabella sp.]|nr:serine hydrolase domain-containing protein [Agriterribacter sp.]HUN04255.1 serine hydrolase domain-containing protein [Niabella sp.]